MKQYYLISVLGAGILLENKSIHQIEMERDENYWYNLDNNKHL